MANSDGNHDSKLMALFWLVYILHQHMKESMFASELSDNVVWAGYCKAKLLQLLKYWGLNKMVDI